MIPHNVPGCMESDGLDSRNSKRQKLGSVIPNAFRPYEDGSLTDGNAKIAPTSVGIWDSYAPSTPDNTDVVGGCPCTCYYQPVTIPYVCQQCISPLLPPRGFSISSASSQKYHLQPGTHQYPFFSNDQSWPNETFRGSSQFPFLPNDTSFYGQHIQNEAHLANGYDVYSTMRPPPRLVPNSPISQISNSLPKDVVQQLDDTYKGLLLGNSSHDELKEAAQPTAIKTELQRHQKQALTFMQQREQRQVPLYEEPGVCEAVATDDGPSFPKATSDVTWFEGHPQCCGGILADLMGLGKTLTMIALAATDLEGDDNRVDTNEERLDVVKTTLVVVTPSLIGTWEEQLSEHVVDGRLTYHVHHGNNRLNCKTELTERNIVLTTYETIAAEWLRSGKSKDSVILSVQWWRIIIDEAHIIRNRTTTKSQAICALKSKSRWAITGTPIQNRPSDLTTLLKFIKAYPDDQLKSVEVDVFRDPEEAIPQLQRLLQPVMLRRVKGTVRLPQRHDLQHPVELNVEERELYDMTNNKTPDGMQKMQSLRLICDLGLHYKPSDKIQNGLDPRSPNIEQLQVNKGLSSKVEALITDIKSRPPEEKCVVFSSWIMTLDIVKDALERSSIPSVRFDGNVAQKDRQEAIKEFKASNSIRVMLLTISCGSVGLNLTEANRAYIMEPHWNPKAEEQALARIYRIGQKRDVTSVRFFVRNSIEEEIIKKQTSKQNLADLLLDSSGSN